jgi:hypothetical protein
MSGTRLKVVSVVALSFLLAPVATAQQTIPPGNFPPEIAETIKSAPLTRTIIRISETETFNQQIIKADEISFAEGARLTLSNLNVSWLVIVAQRIKFANPGVYSIIQRDPSILAGAKGQNGAGGPMAYPG